MWKKIGRIFCPNNEVDWMHSHATVPTPLWLYDDIYRIYFSSRNQHQQNQVGYVEVSLANPSTILRLSEQPVISLGELGYFDCDGVYLTSLVKVDGRIYGYYAGWNAGKHGAFFSAIGVAISQDNGQTFSKYSQAPIIQRDSVDPWAVMAPYVLLDGKTWKMWYTSGIELKKHENGSISSKYDVKSATSHNGLDWVKTGKSAISLSGGTTNIARACVLPNSDAFEAYYPYVSSDIGQYRIGYGRSKDGVAFNRLDDDARANLTVGCDAEWDSLAVTYPYVFDHQGQRYMLYNGNGFGLTGFGLAVWQNHTI